MTLDRLTVQVEHRGAFAAVGLAYQLLDANREPLRRLLQFAPKGDDETEQTLRRGLPTRTAEARTGLRQGHRIAKARLLIAEGTRQWSLVLDGGRMALASVRGPEDAEECESDVDRTADRAANWLALWEIVAALYGRFLAVRFSQAWLQTEAPAMAAWMRS